MIELLIAWGGSEAVKFIAQEVIGELAKGTAEDYVKDFFKQGISDAIGGITNGKVLQKATAQAIKYFLDLIQQELENAELSEGELKKYTKPLKKFIENKSVLEVLVSAFDNDIKFLETKKLVTIGNEINPRLPDEFNWNFVAEQYRRRVKKIIRESDELREILNSENLDKLANQNTEIKPDFDLEKYQEGIREQYGNLKLESLDTSGYAYNQLKLWRMFIPQNVRESQEFLPQVHEIPKEYRQRLKETGQFEEELSQERLEGLRRRYFEQQTRSVLELIENSNYQYLVILGNPGSGKSTLLQYMALQWAELSRKDLYLQPIPILIELRTYVRNHDANKCQNFLDFLEKGSGITCQLPQQELDAKLHNGDAIVMFDGLDEVFDPAKREEIITDIHRFTNVYKNVRVIVTSRVIGYKPQKLRDAEFYHFMLQDLSAEKIEDFIQRWHNLTYQDEAEKERKRERLKRAIKDSRSIKELAGNPLLLTMMAILNRNQELPRDRAELYNQASRVLLHQWDMERALIDAKIDPITIDYKDKQAILRRVAFFMQGNTAGLAGNLILGDDLERIIWEYLKSVDINDARGVARALMEQLRSRNFVLCFVGAEYYAFVHRTFLEYFCAWSFVLQFEKEQKISKKELIEDVFGKHWRDEKWHEVLRLIAGMIDARFVGEIISYLMEQEGEYEKFMNLFLAGKLLFEVRVRHGISNIESRLLEKLKDLTRYEVGYYYDNYYYGPYTDYSRQLRLESDHKNESLVRKINTQAVVVVAETWNDYSTYTWLKQTAKFGFNEDVRREAIQQIIIGWKDKPETLPMLQQLAQYDGDWQVRQEVVRQLADGWKDEPETLSMLKHLVQSDDDRFVRREAVRQLADGWKDEPEMLTILKHLVQSDDNTWVRQEAVEQIATGWKDEPETLSILKHLVQSDDDEDVRVEAVRQLADGWKDEPEMLTTLKHLVQSDDNTWVRQEAIDQIVAGWKDEPETLPMLKHLVQSDNDTWVRQEAVRHLATGWKDEPETLLMLKQLLQSDDDEDVREEAVRHLATGWKDEPEILTMLKYLAHSDDKLRVEVVRHLATGWKDEPETLLMLKHLVKSDDDSVLRLVAMQQLATGWKDESETLPMLKHLVQSDDDLILRREAVRRLVLGWKDEPEILPMLKHLVHPNNNWQVRLEAVRQLATAWKDEPETLPMLKHLLQSDDDLILRCEAMQQLATGWKDDPEILPMIKRCVESNDDKLKIKAVRQLATGWKSKPETLAILKHLVQSNDDSDVRREAVRQLATGWKSKPETLAILKHLVQSNDDSDVRREAVRQLATGWKSKPETLAILKHLVQSNDDSGVRREAVEQIATGWKSKPETLAILKHLVQSNDDSDVRREAVEQIATGWKSKPETLAMLKHLVQSNDEYLKGEAMKQLATDWKRDPETLLIIKQIAQFDSDEYLREEAMEQLATGWKHYPETLPILKQLAQSDDDSNVRQKAVEHLATLGKNNPETLPLLKQLAQSDDDSNIRLEAVQQIAKGWRPDPEMFELFRNCALNDPFQPEYDLKDRPRKFVPVISSSIKYRPFYDDLDDLIRDRLRNEFQTIEDNPRQIALKAIVKHYPEHPQTLPLLKDRAENDPDEQLREWAKKKLQRLEN
ncbi:MAG: NACHT domain-containing protein [Okeania sp. SIO2C9]|uniref:HEAT repeat domain-containing protein n=1 Tax=Okeania sp. SIO2C9 TaxID=2607791 RepID=UPI0013BFCE6D|nr:HEAT repeat domain-containing protein [Okeania sp. SIO2C9]NEQ75319.1 NACHT domain-containing protein [Okeania sp. SIO2C9]